MAIPIAKRKSKLVNKSETRELCSCYTLASRVVSRIPSAVLILAVIFLWSSSSTIISSNIVHVCVSSRKLNNLYCLSAGAQPQFGITIPTANNGSGSPGNNGNREENDVGAITNLITKEPVSTGSPGSSGGVGERKDKDIVLVASAASDQKETLNGDGQSSSGVVQKVIDDVKEGPYSGESDRTSKEMVESLQATKVVEEHIQLHRSWATNENHAACERGGIYVYDLPAKYNKDLVGQCRDMMPWMDFCKYFENEALGENIPELGKSWYRTHQYALEPIFHARILKHPCRVYDENQAKLFYVPYYGGLDVLRWHFKNVSGDVKDTLGLDLVKWLTSKKLWIKNSGKDHVFVLGKISWDFRRNSDSPWGTRFLQLEQMQNPVKLLIERQPWEVNDVGIPHPTNFHPHSDDDIIEWQIKVMRASRKKLVSFAGAARPDQPESIRSVIIKQCNLANNSECQLLDCSTGRCDQPDAIIGMFMGSEFCLQPPGDSPTRKSVFDSLVSGCIPVLFDPFTAYYQYPWHLPEDHTRYSVFIDQEEMKQGKVNLMERLMNISERERENMRRYIVYELLPGLVYGDLSSQLGKFSDAFTLTVNNLFERANKL